MSFRRISSHLPRIEGRCLYDSSPDPRRVLRGMAWAVAAAVACFLGVLCAVEGFNPFAWAWGLCMELARAVGGH